MERWRLHSLRSMCHRADMFSRGPTLALSPEADRSQEALAALLGEHTWASRRGQGDCGAAAPVVNKGQARLVGRVPTPPVQPEPVQCTCGDVLEFADGRI